MENIYNKKKEFEEEVKPIIMQLLSITAARDMPCFVTVAVENTDKKTTYESTAVTPASINIELTDDKIKDHMLIRNGFGIKLLDEIETVEEMILNTSTGSEDDFLDNIPLDE